MKKGLIITGLFTLILSGCLNIEETPLVTLDPSVFYQLHVKNQRIFLNAEIRANPDFIEVGNIPTHFEYSGTVELYDEISGELLSSTEIEGEGLSTLVEITADKSDYEHVIAIT